MSKFFRGGSSSESSSSRSSSSDESENEMPVQQTATGAPRQKSRFELSDSDSEDEKRVILSAKQKLRNEVRDFAKNIEYDGAFKEWDWAALEEVLNALVKLGYKMEKARVFPLNYGRVLLKLSKTVDEAFAEKDTFSEARKKAVTKMRNTLKKLPPVVKTQIDREEKEPTDSADDWTSEEEGGSGSESGSESESGDSESGEKPAVEDRRSKWLTKESGGDKKADKDEEKKPKKPKDSSRTKEKKTAEETEDQETIEWNDETVQKKIDEILTNRGKKATKVSQQIEQFSYLLTKTENKMQKLALRMHITAARFDTASNLNNFMSVETWHECHTEVNSILDSLQSDPSLLTIPESESSGAAAAANEAAAALAKTIRIAAQELIRNSLVAFVTRLDDELVKSLQFMDHHTDAYVKRLADDKLFLTLAERVQRFYDSHDQRNIGTLIVFRRIEHMYYTLDTDTNAVTKEGDLPANWSTAGAPFSALTAALTPAKGDVSSVLQVLAARIYHESREQLMKVKTMLAHIYHHAISDRYHTARDMLLMSGLTTDVPNDPLTQILYNRTITQVGLCAFRAGLIQEAHGCLFEICAGRQKELLGQGPSTRFGERTPEQERLERRRQVPFHRHINLDMLECVHLTSAMLLEVPNTAASHHDHKRKVISKTFRKYQEIQERLIFAGTPDNVRDSVLAAARAINNGDWKEAVRVLLALPAWNLIHQSSSECERIRAMVTENIKVETLRTYLFLHSNTYASISLEMLSSMFDLPSKRVHAVVSKMIINEELKGLWDQLSSCIILQRTEPTRLQYLALCLADKATALLEANERTFEAKMGPAPVQEQPAGGRGRNMDQNRNNQRGGRGGYSDRGGRGGYSDRGGDRQRGGGDRGDRQRGGGGGGRGMYSRGGYVAAGGDNMRR